MKCWYLESVCIWIRRSEADSVRLFFYTCDGVRSKKPA